MGKTKMTPEVKAQLLGLLPMNNDAKHSFTPKMFSEIPEEFQPVYTVKQLPQSELIRVKEMMVKDVTTKKKKSVSEIAKRNVLYMEILHKVFVGWENVFWPDTGLPREYNGSFEDFTNNTDECLQAILGETLKVSGVKL